MAFRYDEIDSERFEDQVYFAPSQWQPLAEFQVPAVRFVAAANQRLRPDNTDDYYVIFPVSDDYLLKFCFSTFRDRMWIDNDTPVHDLESWLPIAPMEELINQIMSTIKINVSEQALIQMQKAQSGLQDTSLVKEFSPVNIIAFNQKKR